MDSRTMPAPFGTTREHRALPPLTRPAARTRVPSAVTLQTTVPPVMPRFVSDRRTGSVIVNGLPARGALGVPTAPRASSLRAALLVSV